MAIERMRGWKDACQNRQLPDLCHQSVLIRTSGGGTVEGCTKLQSPRDFINSPATGPYHSTRSLNLASVAFSHCMLSTVSGPPRLSGPIWSLM